MGRSISIGTEAGNYYKAKNRQITAIEDYTEGGNTYKAISFSGSSANIAVGDKIWGAPQMTGQTDVLTIPSGSLADDFYHSIRYRYIENVFGNIWQLLDGINITNYTAYVCEDYKQYANGFYEAPYYPINYTNSILNDKYITQVGYDSNYPLIAIPTIADGGSSSTYLCDSQFTNSGNRVVAVGGAGSGSNAKNGFFSWNIGGATNNTSWNRGTRLMIHTV